MTEEEIQALQTQLEAEKAEKARLEETNKRLYARTKEAEGFTQDADGNWVKKPEQKIISEPIAAPNASDILKSPEFRLHREGFSEDHIALIMKNGGPDILKDKTNPIVLGIEAAQAQQRAERAASETSDANGTSDIERKYTEADLRKMTAEELAKVLPHVDK